MSISTTTAILEETEYYHLRTSNVAAGHCCVAFQYLPVTLEGQSDKAYRFKVNSSNTRIDGREFWLPKKAVKVKQGPQFLCLSVAPWFTPEGYTAWLFDQAETNSLAS